MRLQIQQQRNGDALEIGVEPTVRLVTYGDAGPGDREVAATAQHLSAIAADAVYRADDIRLDRAVDVSALSLARRLAGVFDRV